MAVLATWQLMLSYHVLPAAGKRFWDMHVTLASLHSQVTLTFITSLMDLSSYKAKTMFITFTVLISASGGSGGGCIPPPAYNNFLHVKNTASNQLNRASDSFSADQVPRGRPLTA